MIVKQGLDSGLPKVRVEGCSARQMLCTNFPNQFFPFLHITCLLLPQIFCVCVLGVINGLVGSRKAHFMLHSFNYSYVVSNINVRPRHSSSG
jgi:hypothetical protein